MRPLPNATPARIDNALFDTDCWSRSVSAEPSR
jgi:hypothetical protein